MLLLQMPMVVYQVTLQVYSLILSRMRRAATNISFLSGNIMQSGIYCYNRIWFSQQETASRSLYFPSIGITLWHHRRSSRVTWQTSCVLCRCRRRHARLDRVQWCVCACTGRGIQTRDLCDQSRVQSAEATANSRVENYLIAHGRAQLDRSLTRYSAEIVALRLVIIAWSRSIDNCYLSTSCRQLESNIRILWL